MFAREGAIVLIIPMARGFTQMSTKFKVGDHVAMHKGAALHKLD